jgi:hypothetical protein
VSVTRPRSSHRPPVVILAALTALVLLAVGGTSLHVRRRAVHLAATRRAPLTNVTCGESVSTSIRVNNDLNCSATGTDGLDVGANHITIDLNGHTFQGNTSHYGVVNFGFTNVTIENGTVSGWQLGLVIGGAGDVVRSMVLKSNSQYGIEANTAGVRITHNVAVLNTLIGIYAPVGDTITNNVVRQNGGYGISTGGGLVKANKVEN